MSFTTIGRRPSPQTATTATTTEEPRPRDRASPSTTNSHRSYPRSKISIPSSYLPITSPGARRTRITSIRRRRCGHTRRPIRRLCCDGGWIDSWSRGTCIGGTRSTRLIIPYFIRRRGCACSPTTNWSRRGGTSPRRRTRERTSSGISRPGWRGWPAPSSGTSRCDGSTNISPSRTRRSSWRFISGENGWRFWDAASSIGRSYGTSGGGIRRGGRSGWDWSVWPWSCSTCRTFDCSGPRTNGSTSSFGGGGST
mmetsp:Transcript_36113/g.108054  ORF Transcript_36113/g.108054 Transcript_36113/m.108054 type:complete len:253 (-) Transcript_36113:603-1361(-)